MLPLHERKLNLIATPRQHKSRITSYNVCYTKLLRGDHTIWSRASPEVMAKNIIADDRNIGPQAFVDYDHLDFTFRPGQEGLPEIPFGEIGLRLDAYRRTMPDKGHYRRVITSYSIHYTKL